MKEEEPTINDYQYKLDITEIHGCKHDLYYEGGYIKCRHCTAEWYDPSGLVWRDIEAGENQNPE